MVSGEQDINDELLTMGQSEGPIQRIRLFSLTAVFEVEIMPVRRLSMVEEKQENAGIPVTVYLIARVLVLGPAAWVPKIRQ